SYTQSRCLNLNGNSNSGDAFWCQGTHHLRFINNSMSDTGTAGIGTRDCDYLTADHNLIYHNGYMPASTPDPQWYGWTSGISYNSNQWFDTYPGFHNIISNNIVAGEFDSSSNHTDGNGIILDLSNGSYNASTTNTPPVLLIINDRRFGRCPGAGGALHGAAINIDRFLGHQFRRTFLRNLCLPTHSHPAPEFPIEQQPYHRVRQLRGIARRHQQAGAAVFDHFR